jgi:predicted nuclease of predicted toxin-antitoxin system
MAKFLSDEDFNNHIVRGLYRRLPAFDLVRVQNVGLIEHHDTEVLAWAAQEGRIVLTHDFATMLDFAYNRVGQGLPMPGVVAISQDLPIGEAIEELVIFIECSLEGEWEGQVVHLP